jgi:hypothetical protein
MSGAAKREQWAWGRRPAEKEPWPRVARQLIASEKRVGAMELEELTCMASSALVYSSSAISLGVLPGKNETNMLEARSRARASTS